jgi:phosphoglycolate phosphatase
MRNQLHADSIGADSIGANPISTKPRRRLSQEMQVTEYESNTIRAILFDFDGTLSNSLELGYEIMQMVCERNNLRVLPQEEYRTLGTRALMKKMGIPVWALPRLMREGRELMATRICEATPVSGIDAALTTLRQQGIVLGIVTSNSEENVSNWLAHFGLAHLFDTVHGGGRLLRKERCIKRCIKNLGIPKSQVVYVGDEGRDIMACQRLKIRTVAVTWGLDVPEKLIEHSPWMIVDHPQQLCSLIQQSTTSAA